MKRKYCDAAHAVALCGFGVGGRAHNNFRIGAILITRNRSITAVNSYRTSPRLVRHYVYPVFHAESACIFRAGFDACSGASLYVARVRRDNTLALAKPCGECQKLIELVGIRRVYYSTEVGAYKCL